MLKFFRSLATKQIPPKLSGAPGLSNTKSWPTVLLLTVLVTSAPAAADWLQAVHSGLCLGVSEAQSGSEIVQSECKPSATQKVSLREAGSSEVQIELSGTGLCFDVLHESKRDGARLSLYRCHNKDNQRFQLQRYDDGSVRFVAKHSDKCVDVSGESMTAGAVIYQWSCHDGANQRFRITRGVPTESRPRESFSDAPPGKILPRLAIIPSVPSDPLPTPERLFSAFDTIHQAGARGTYVAYTWSQLEPRSGKYDGIEELKGALEYISKRFDIYLKLEVVKTTVKEVPSDLRRERFDSERMRNRFQALLDRLLPVLTPRVRTLTIGTEVDVYFAAHGEADAYRVFFQNAVDYIRSRAPGLLVGVSTTFEETQGAQRGHLARLRELSDFAEITYYAMGDAFRPRGANAIQDDWPKMLEFARGKPLLLEVGYTSSQNLGSSEQAQAEVVELALKLWAKDRDRVPVLNLFQLHDESLSTCEKEATYYGVPKLRDAYAAFRCSLGLKRADGSPKPAWAVVLKVPKP